MVQVHLGPPKKVFVTLGFRYYPLGKCSYNPIPTPITIHLPYGHPYPQPYYRSPSL